MTALPVYLALSAPRHPLNGCAHRHTHTHTPPPAPPEAWGSHPFPAASGDLRRCTCSPGGPIPSTEENTRPWEGLPLQQPCQASRSQRDQGTACLRLKASRPAQICQSGSKLDIAGSFPKRNLVLILQFFSCVQLFATPRTAAHQASLSFISQSLLKLIMSAEPMMPSNHLILLTMPALQPPRK